MRIQLNSVTVDDQDKALRFYTDVLGFVKKQDFPVGEAKWLTVVSPEGPDDVELVLDVTVRTQDQRQGARARQHRLQVRTCQCVQPGQSIRTHHGDNAIV